MLFAAVERAIWRLPQTRALRDALGPGMLHYVDMGRLSKAYPGVRCDGMHYNSGLVFKGEPASNDSWCRGSPAVYDLAILDAMLDGGSVLAPSNVTSVVPTAGIR